MLAGAQISQKNKKGIERPRTTMKRPAGYSLHSNLQSILSKSKSIYKRTCKTPDCKRPARTEKRFQRYCRPCHKLYGTSIKYCRAYGCWKPAQSGVRFDGYCRKHSPKEKKQRLTFSQWHQARVYQKLSAADIPREKCKNSTREDTPCMNDADSRKQYEQYCPTCFAEKYPDRMCKNYNNSSCNKPKQKDSKFDGYCGFCARVQKGTQRECDVCKNPALRRERRFPNGEDGWTILCSLCLEKKRDLEKLHKEMSRNCTKK